MTWVECGLSRCPPTWARVGRGGVAQHLPPDLLLPADLMVGETGFPEHCLELGSVDHFLTAVGPDHEGQVAPVHHGAVGDVRVTFWLVFFQFGDTVGIADKTGVAAGESHVILRQLGLQVGSGVVGRRGGGLGGVGVGGMKAGLGVEGVLGEVGGGSEQPGNCGVLALTVIPRV